MKLEELQQEWRHIFRGGGCPMQHLKVEGEDTQSDTPVELEQHRWEDEGGMIYGEAE